MRRLLILAAKIAAVFRISSRQLIGVPKLNLKVDESRLPSARNQKKTRSPRDLLFITGGEAPTYDGASPSSVLSAPLALTLKTTDSNNRVAITPLSPFVVSPGAITLPSVENECRLPCRPARYPHGACC